MNDTDTRIRQAALELFASKGYEATGIRELGERAGITSAALYHYVGNKRELLVAIMRDALQRLVLAANAALQGVDEPAARLSILTQVHVLAHVLYSLEARVVDTELRALDLESRADVVQLRDAYERLWKEALQEGVAEGVFTVPNTSLARLAILEMATGVAHWYSPERGMSPEELALGFSDLALAQVQATGEGRQLVTRDLHLVAPKELKALLEAAGTPDPGDSEHVADLLLVRRPRGDRRTTTGRNQSDVAEAS